MPIPIILILVGGFVASMYLLNDMKKIKKSTKEQIEKTNKMCEGYKFYIK